MLPPIDPSILEQNPRFKSLVKDLTTTRLNTDGSTKDAKQQRQRTDIRKRQDAAQSERAKTQLLKDGLQHVAARSSQLPLELQEVVQLVSAQLAGRVALEDREFLEDDVEYFLENIDTVAVALDQHLTNIATHLSQIASPETTEVAPAALPSTLIQQRRDFDAARADSNAFRSELAQEANNVLSAQRALTETTIRILEQTMHGSVARGTRAKAEHLAVVARGMKLKVQILAATAGAEGADPELQKALDAYAAHLDASERGLRERERDAERRLREYEASGGTGMREIARRKTEIEGEIRGVEAEIARLEG